MVGQSITWQLDWHIESWIPANEIKPSALIKQSKRRRGERRPSAPNLPLIGTALTLRTRRRPFTINLYVLEVKYCDREIDYDPFVFGSVHTAVGAIRNCMKSIFFHNDRLWKSRSCRFQAERVLYIEGWCCISHEEVESGHIRALFIISLKHHTLTWSNWRR